MLSAGGLQALLKHLHQLLLPIITLSVSNTAESGGLPAPSGATDSKAKLAVTAKDLDILLAVLEALASCDAAADGHDGSQVCVLCCQTVLLVCTCTIATNQPVLCSVVHLHDSCIMQLVQSSKAEAHLAVFML